MADSNYIRIAVDPDVAAKVTALARQSTHIPDLAPGRAIEWAIGEIKALQRRVALLERAQQAEPTTPIAA